MSLFITADTARYMAIHSLTPESEEKNVLANISQDIMENAFKGKNFIVEPGLHDEDLRKSVFRKLENNGFVVKEEKDRFLIFWCDADTIESILKEREEKR